MGGFMGAVGFSPCPFVRQIFAQQSHWSPKLFNSLGKRVSEDLWKIKINYGQPKTVCDYTNIYVYKKQQFFWSN